MVAKFCWKISEAMCGNMISAHGRGGNILSEECLWTVHAVIVKHGTRFSSFLYPPVAPCSFYLLNETIIVVIYLYLVLLVTVIYSMAVNRVSK